MKRRQFLLATCGWGLALGQAWPGQDLRRADFFLESEIYRAQRLAYKSTEVYQKWRNGGDTRQAQQAFEQTLTELTRVQARIEKLASSGRLAALRHWARQLRQEVTFLSDDVQDTSGHRRSQQELQQRWRASVQMQRELLQVRRSKIPELLGAAGSPSESSFYQWRASLLKVLEGELQLCEELARAFEANRAAPELEEKALDLFGQTCLIRPPQACRKAHQCYLERFTALKRLCESAQSLTDPDVLDNLRYTEGEYRKLALACEAASLQALAQVLGLPVPLS